MAEARIPFPGGAKDVLRLYLDETDRQMARAFRRQVKKEARIRDRIALAVRLKIGAFGKHREATRRAVIALALPSAADLAAASLWRTVDMIWKVLGDTSVDFNFYSRRALLAAVYSSTLMYWLADESENYAETEAFLDRRIGDVMKIQKTKAGRECLTEALEACVRGAGRLRYFGHARLTL